MLISMVPPPASMIKTCSPDCEHVKQQTLDDDSTTDLEVSNRLGMGSAKVETCLAFGQKVDAGVSGRGVGDDTRFDCRSSQSCLLWASPSVGMG